jgi:hypothetical protein
MAQSIVSVLQRSGTSTKAVALSPSANSATSRSALLKTKADKYIWLILNEWKTNTYLSSRLIYDVTLEILGPHGKSLGTKVVAANKFLGTDAINPPQMSRVEAPKAFKKIIEELFNSPDIVRALK